MSNFTRIDNRNYYSLRPVSFKLNPLKTGPSCKIEIGNIKNKDGIFTAIGGRTSVISLLLFSNESRSKNTTGSFHKPYMEAFIRPATGTIKSYIRSMESILVKVMQKLINTDKLPKVTVSFRVQIIEDSGGLLSVCINSLILCLSLSGIGIYQVPYAVSFGIVNPEYIAKSSESSDGNKPSEILIIDPTDYEIRTYCSTSLTVLSDPDTGDLLLITVDFGSGRFGNHLELIRKLAKKSAIVCLKILDDVKKEQENSYYVTLEANK